MAPTVTGGPILRALLTTNGSITLLLEAFFGEQMKVVKLSEREVSSEEDQPNLDIKAGDPTLERTILLRGSISRRTYLHAHSTIALDNISPNLKTSLITTEEPIGKLWARNRTETYKRILDIRKQLAGDIAQQFDLDQNSLLVSRTYQVFSNQNCAMLIRETFPENLAEET